MQYHVLLEQAKEHLRVAADENDRALSKLITQKIDRVRKATSAETIISVQTISPGEILRLVPIFERVTVGIESK